LTQQQLQVDLQTEPLPHARAPGRDHRPRETGQPGDLGHRRRGACCSDVGGHSRGRGSAHWL